MKEYIITYQRTDGSFRFTFINANNIYQAKELVYNDKLDCVQILSAECNY